MADIWSKPFTQQTQPSAQLNPFYNPGSTYGSAQDWNDTPLSGQIREQNPQLAYTQYGQNIGLTNQNSAFRDWFYNQYPEFQRGYGLATLRNPLITVDQYMETLPGMDALRQVFMQQSPGARGERASVYAPAARWIGR